MEAACSYLVVPEDRSDPAAPTIRVHVIKIAAANPDPAPDPVISPTATSLLCRPGMGWCLPSAAWI